MTRAGRPAPVLLARLAPALAVALALAACGGKADSARTQVAAYVTRVNRVETALTAPLNSVTRVSAGISTRSRHGLTVSRAATAARQLAADLTQIHAQQRRLAGLPAPVQAQRLRALLLKLAADEAGLAAQLRLLVTFLPRFAAATAPLGPALTRLEHVLDVREAAGLGSVAAVYAAKAAALRRFAALTRRIVRRLRAIIPPAVSRPSYRAELSSLRGMGSSAGRLADALAGGAPGNVTPLLVGFDRAALATRAVSVQKAQIAAVKAYDARIRAMNALSSQVYRERYRLASSAA